MNNWKKWLLILFFFLPAGIITAQNDLKIEQVFDAYGKKEGSILIELATDVLGNHTKITSYKSLIVPFGEEILEAANEAIGIDTKEGSKLIESQKDGTIETGYYCLKKKESTSLYEYILYKNKSKKITLVYIKGNFPPQQLDNELDKLKDLFITVNKKRIKLQ